MTNGLSVPPCSSFPTSFATENERLNCLIYASELCMNPSEAADLQMTQAGWHHCSSAARNKAERRNAGGNYKDLLSLSFSLFERTKYTTVPPPKFVKGFFYIELKKCSYSLPALKNVAFLRTVAAKFPVPTETDGHPQRQYNWFMFLFSTCSKDRNRSLYLISFAAFLWTNSRWLITDMWLSGQCDKSWGQRSVILDYFWTFYLWKLYFDISGACCLSFSLYCNDI